MDWQYDRCVTKMWLLKLIFIALCLACPNVIAQNTVMKNRGLETVLRNGQIIQKHLYAIEDGLASNDVYCGKQDEDGFIWLGTRNGLNHFDGKNFKLFNWKNGKRLY